MPDFQNSLKNNLSNQMGRSGTLKDSPRPAPNVAREIEKAMKIFKESKLKIYPDDTKALEQVLNGDKGADAQKWLVRYLLKHQAALSGRSGPSKHEVQAEVLSGAAIVVKNPESFSRWTIFKKLADSASFLSLHPQEVRLGVFSFFVQGDRSAFEKAVKRVLDNSQTNLVSPKSQPYSVFTTAKGQVPLTNLNYETARVVERRCHVDLDHLWSLCKREQPATIAAINDRTREERYRMKGDLVKVYRKYEEYWKCRNPEKYALIEERCKEGRRDLNAINSKLPSLGFEQAEKCEQLLKGIQSLPLPQQAYFLQRKLINCRTDFYHFATQGNISPLTTKLCEGMKNTHDGWYSLTCAQIADALTRTSNNDRGQFLSALREGFGAASNLFRGNQLTFFARFELADLAYNAGIFELVDTQKTVFLTSALDHYKDGIKSVTIEIEGPDKAQRGGAFGSMGSLIADTRNRGYAPCIIQLAKLDRDEKFLRLLGNRGPVADHLVLAGHGSPTSITIGYRPSITDPYSFPRKDTSPRQYQINVGEANSFLKAVGNLVKPKGSIVLVSCQTGQGEYPIAEYVAQQTGRRTVAPRESIFAPDSLFEGGKPFRIFRGGDDVVDSFHAHDVQTRIVIPPRDKR